ILLFFSIVSCSDFRKLNHSIYDAQKSHFLESPYKPSNRYFSNIESQKKFRAKYFPKLFKDKPFLYPKLNDTLYILEDYVDTNLGAGDKIQLLYRDTVYQIENVKEFDSINYQQVKVNYRVQKDLFNPT